MPEKFYISDNGSKVREFGEHLGSYYINWDWFEEGVCVEARPFWDQANKCIIATCRCCEDGPFVVKCREVTKEEFMEGEE